MAVITESQREDIQTMLDEIDVEVRMARNGAEVAQSETSEQRVRYAVIAIREHLKRIDEIKQELETALAEIVEPVKVEPPRSSRSLRGRRGE